jgi:hypothetical protein
MANEPGGLAASVRRQIAEGRPADDIVDHLVAGGLSKPSARRFVDRALAEQGGAERADPTTAPMTADSPVGQPFPWMRAIFAAALVALAYPGYLVVSDAIAARRARDEEWVRTVTEDRAHAEGLRKQAGAAYDERASRLTANVEDAIDTLRTGRDAARCDAAIALGRSGSDAAREPLIAVLRTPNVAPFIQSCIVGALVDLGETAVALGYYNMWIDGDNPDLWRAAIIGYGKVGPQSAHAAVRGLERAMLSENWDLRYLAVQSAAKIGAPAETVLRAAADDEHEMVRGEARQALAALEQ